RAPHVRDAVMHPVHRVVSRRLPRLHDVRVLRERVAVDRRAVAVRDQPIRGVPAGRHAVVERAPLLTHQVDHLVRRVAVLHGHLATGLVLERLHPRLLRVSGPGDQAQLPLALRARVVAEGLGRSTTTTTTATTGARALPPTGGGDERKHRDDREGSANSPHAPPLPPTGPPGPPAPPTLRPPRPDGCSAGSRSGV